MRSHRTITRFLLLWSFCAVAAFAQGQLTFSPQTFPNLVVGQRSVLPFEVNGGTQPYTLSLTSGQIPPGFTFNPNNPIQLIGTSTAAGTYTFTLLATDSSTPAQTASQTFTVTAVIQPLVLLPTGNLSGGVVGAPYPSSIYAQGGIPPYHWSIKYGTLPASSGLTLNPTTNGQNAQGLPGQAITGTPQTAGTYSFTLQVTDSNTTPVTVSQTYSLSVINPTSYLDPISHPAPPASGQTTLPTGITATTGPNAALWFTQQGAPIVGSVVVHGIESLTTSGVFQHETELPIYPSVTPFPQAISPGPDGNLWVTDQSSNYLYSVKPDGSSVTPITLQTSGVPPDPVTPSGITSGNEGGVWFTGQGSTQIGYIGRVTPGSNAVNFFQIPAPISNPLSIVQDPADSNHFWFLAQAGPVSSPTVVLGRINPTNGAFEVPSGCQAFNQLLGFAGFSGCIIEHADGTLVAPDSSVLGQSVVGPLIVVGSDGAIWFATANGLGRITTDGANVSFYPTSTGIQSMTLGSDQAIWFTETPLGSNLARISPSGQIITFNIPNTANTPNFDGVTVGPDGAIWMADNVNNAIVQVFPSLALNCTVPGTLEVGVPIVNASCTAFGGKPPYTYSFDRSHLPPGVTVNANGVLSGTPTAPGSFTITANDSSSPAQQASQVFSIQAAPTIQVVCNFPATAKAGQPYSGSCLTAGGTPPYTYSAPNLPAGLTGVAVNNATSGDYEYDVSGTLSRSAHGNVAFTITATDSSTPADSSAPVSITVAVTPLPAAISCSANTDAIVGKPFQQTCFGLLGNPPYTFAATGLPAGLAINHTTGVISGTPSAPGASTVSVVLTDTAGQTATQAITLTVINPKLALVCDFSPVATQGVAYSTTCDTSGGVAPYSYSVLSGALPAGLHLDSSSGAVTGTPTNGGYVSFTLQVKDANAAVAQQSVSFLVNPTSLTILTTTLPVPNSSLPYAVEVLAAGGTAPYTYSISAGALPAGLQLDAHVGAITPVSGATLATGHYSFTVQVTDAASAKATQTYTGTVLAPLVQNFSSFAIPETSGGNGITVGPDGALWFTTLDQSGGNLLGRITTAGVITTTPAANALTTTNIAAGELPAGGDIITGPDGQLWTAQRDGNAIAELPVALSPQISYLPTTAGASPAQLTSAPDGAVWFTEAATSQIARVDSSGKFTEFAAPSPSSFPSGIVLGPRNLVIFTEPVAGRIGFISEDGTTKVDFPTPTSGSLPLSIVMGPDNALWFTEYGAKKIGRIDFAGTIQEVPVSSNPVGITLGPDGALYFTEPNANAIGRITIFGSVIEIPVSDANSGPTGIVTGPDGSIWFTESNLSKIGRLSFILAPTVSCALPGTLAAGSAFSATCTGSQGTAPYTFSTSGNLPPGLSINPTTGVLSGTLTTAGTFTFDVILTDSSSPPQVAKQSYTYKVTPLPLSLTCNVPTARLYTQYVGVPATPGGATPSYGCTAANGTPPYTYAVTSGTLPPGLSINASSGVISGTPTTLGNYPVTVQVTDSSVPPMKASQTPSLSVQYGTVTGRGTPLFTLSTPPTSVAPGAQTPGLTLTVNEPLLQATTASAVLTFKLSPDIPTSGVLGQTYTTPADYTDPAMQFVDASGNALTSTYNFTIPPGVTSVTLPAMNPGTVLGTITLTITAAGLPQTATSFPVSGIQPTIEAGSVQFTNVTSSGFDIEFVATAPTRTANYATITFNAASGSTISGQQMFVFDVSSATNEWFASADGLKYGGRYSLTIPFEFNGPISAISSATVMLSIGTENSAPVTGNR